MIAMHFTVFYFVKCLKHFKTTNQIHKGTGFEQNKSVVEQSLKKPEMAVLVYGSRKLRIEHEVLHTFATGARCLPWRRCILSMVSKAFRTAAGANNLTAKNMLRREILVPEFLF